MLAFVDGALAACDLAHAYVIPDANGPISSDTELQTPVLTNAVTAWESCSDATKKVVLTGYHVRLEVEHASTVL